MESMKLTFDEVFKVWLDAEVMAVEGREILSVAKSKGFTSITEWRLNTALRLGMDTKEWVLQKIDNPNETLPNIIIGPYQGWSRFFDNQLNTTFAQAVEIPEFFEWCKTHDRVVPLSQKFPSPTTLILFRKESGEYIHIEGGHRICAVAFAQKLGKPIKFNDNGDVFVAVTEVKDSEVESLKTFLRTGTDKK
ncbi:TPA: hypothetical protein DCG61_01000 [Patescibacteria group bacterium]|nr:hypothetical protein [Patescibacteria group bacterium]